MKAKYLLFLILIGFFSSCLNSAYSIEIEASSDISFADCSFYGFWADTLWCADSLFLNHRIVAGDSIFSLEAIKYFNTDDCINHCKEYFLLSIPNFQGIGNYRIAKSSTPSVVAFKFAVFDYDFFRSFFELKEEQEGDYGELIITHYNRQSNLLRGEIRGQITNKVGGTEKRFLKGGRFEGILQRE